MNENKQQQQQQDVVTDHVSQKMKKAGAMLHTRRLLVHHNSKYQ
jgi:hypothetical protein